MEEKDSFDSENYFSDNESETKARSSNIDNEEGDKEIRNMNLIKAISQVLETIIEDNKHLIKYGEIIKKQNKSVFSSIKIINISIEEYLTRIQTYANIERNTLIVSLIFIDRLCKNSGITLTYYNIHRIIFTSILVSIKYNEDQLYDNKYYSEIAGLRLKELNSLEYNFLQMIHFFLFVNDETFKKYKLYLDNF